MSSDQFEVAPHNIMFITDNQVDIKKIERAFMDIGSMECQLFTCATVDKAVEYIAQRRIAMEMIILDLRSKNVGDPLDLCKEVFEKIPDVLVMALDDKGEGNAVQAAAVKAAGVVEYIDRTQFDELVFRIKKLINTRF
ncbi:MAG: hypothetical protein HYS17_09355 [Micavibrio aeruginosavorus]|uniref:Response regulatory domain-containing protein n=1 Tax=Micavibrio aeruginosavorus TaxID=349221 RepID=A0A7T5R1F2_9BACT|nr:MAG: hypothetical protein HYS17_09355 [Micavibrio aeruginosavorus]